VRAGTAALAAGLVLASGLLVALAAAADDALEFMTRLLFGN